MAINFGKAIKEIWKLENGLYWLQSKLIPTKHKNWYKKTVCNDCWKAGYCLSCGCDIEDMFNSDKPCPRGKFGNKQISLAIRIILYFILIYGILWLI